MSQAENMTIVVGVTGASGAVLAQAALRLLEADSRVARIHLVVTETGARLLAHELNIATSDTKQLPSLLIGGRAEKTDVLPNKDVGASIASGSYPVDAMVVIPCSMGTLATIYDGLDSLNRAVNLYEHAISLSDSAPVYLNNLAYTFATRGINLDAAKTLSEAALKAEPKNGAYLDTMGWIEFMSGHYDQAIDLLKKAIKVSSDGTDIYEHLGDAYSKTGDHGKAEKMYRRALEKNPQNESLRRKLAQ